MLLVGACAHKMILKKILTTYHPLWHMSNTFFLVYFDIQDITLHLR